MPLMRCENDGYRWGEHGKCYHGPDAKKKAIKQGYAQDPKHFREVMSSEGFELYETEMLLSQILRENYEKRQSAQSTTTLA